MKLFGMCAALVAVVALTLATPADARRRYNPPGPVGGPGAGNPPGPVGGPGTNWRNPPGPAGGPGAGAHYRGWHYRAWNGRNYYWNAGLGCWFLPDRDDNPPGPNGGPGTNWENPPGPAGGAGASPDRNVCR